MDFKELESFVTIAKVKSFSKASEELFFTQPALSNHISKLEKELGITLFERNNRKTVLTPAGKQFYISAQEILNQRENALLSLEKYQGKIDGMLQIATSSVPGQYIMPDILTGFHKIYPDVSFNLHYLSSGELISQIVAGDLDFGFVGASPDNRNIVYEKVADDELVVIAPNREPFIQMTSITFERLLDEPLLLRKEGSGTRKAFDNAYNAFALLGKPAHILSYMDNNEMIMLCVKAGLGLSLVSQISIEDKVKAGFLKVLPVEDYDFHHAFYFVYAKNRSLSPLVMRFRDFTLQNAGFVIPYVPTDV
ncbi:MAG: selenium metabolism-associated LysR family transcriptional regulator [Eubacteriales bacterium]|jgi:DNA-binding transcriptional LysR family regulator|nr:selenium metabolism-associated LysR family transcriptional regulator [Eubacteriales bacterium]